MVTANQLWQMGVVQTRVWDGQYITNGELEGLSKVVHCHTHTLSLSIHQHTPTAGRNDHEGKEQVRKSAGEEKSR